MGRIKEEKKSGRIYKGAEWLGPELLSPLYGTLKQGLIYPVPEEQAKNTKGFKPVYETEIKKGDD